MENEGDSYPRGAAKYSARPFARIVPLRNFQGGKEEQGSKINASVYHS